ncbi:MAG: hypothetical protein AAFV96_16820, partial [Pseudomonadota bacterium]
PRRTPLAGRPRAKAAAARRPNIPSDPGPSLDHPVEPHRPRADHQNDDGEEEQPDPSLAAISSGLILLAIIVLVIGSRTVGLNRMIQG